MEQKIRLLGIAPYSEMRPLMLEVSKEYQDIDLTGRDGPPEFL